MYPIVNDDSEIFISYAHLDNRVLPGQEQGWVSIFHQTLKVFLGEKLSPEPKIWRDVKLGGTDLITDTILGRLAAAKVMISILSPRYLDSIWCMREVEQFCIAAAENGGIRVNERARIVKVVKYPPHRSPPDVFSDLLGFEFFENKDEGTLEFRLEFGPEAMQKFFFKVNDLANEIKNLLEALRRGQQNPPVPPPKSLCVFLAETTPDLEGVRDNIKRELIQRKYTVLPDGPLPENAGDFIDAVRAHLAQSKLSVHLIGNEYGSCPKGETRSVVQLQNDLAAERADDEGFSRIIWMPPDLKLSESRPNELQHYRFVNSLQNSDSSGISELLQTPLEVLKTEIQDKIEQKPSDLKKPLKPQSIKLIYLIYDKLDSDRARVLRAALVKNGYEVNVPNFEGEDPHRDHNNKLLICDGALVLWDRASDFWLRTKLSDLAKIQASSPPPNIRAKALYISGEESELKDGFLTSQARIIKRFGQINASLLKPFLDALENGWEDELDGTL